MDISTELEPKSTNTIWSENLKYGNAIKSQKYLNEVKKLYLFSHLYLDGAGLVFVIFSVGL